MFTGLVEDIGTIAAVRPRGAGRVLEVRTSIDLSEVRVGDSVAVDGVCLTVEQLGAQHFSVTAARETVEHSTVGGFRAGRRVHLERALQLGGRLDGHLVQGHVDALGTVARSTSDRESLVLWIEVPTSVCRYVAPKGSVTIDGVSLTVNELEGCRFRVNLVPHTAARTHLVGLRPGDRVNLETDLLARYLERLLDARPASGGDLLDTLRRSGFVP